MTNISEENTSPFIRIKQRCENSKYVIEPEEINTETQRVQLRLPAGRSYKELLILNSSYAVALLKIPFENVHGIKGFRAIFSYKDKFIEAMLDDNNPFGMPPDRTFNRLSRMVGKSEESSSTRIVLSSDEDRYKDIKISIGFATDTFATIEAFCVPNWRPMGDRYLQNMLTQKKITLLIEGVSISTYEHTVSILETIKDAVLFQIDRLYGIQLYLSLDRNEEKPRQPRPRGTRGNLSFPKFQYEKNPMSLYWYASQAKELPLLQYLAYYQAIEYYFPIFAKQETHDIVKRMVKDPTFQSSLDANVSKLLAAIQPFIGKGYGEESKLLLTTVRSAVTNDELREFFKQDEERFNFFKLESKAIVPKEIAVDSSKADLVTDTAQRIYDIRCKIVHTKSSEMGDQFELLLPYSKEVSKLSYDIELVRFIAAKVLIAASQPMQL